jgi:hypothetical protein
LRAKWVKEQHLLSTCPLKRKCGTANFSPKKINELAIDSKRVTMSKPLRISIVITWVLVLAGTLFVPQINAQPNYYSNNFDSASALNDGYWSLHDAEIQTIGGSNVLGVDGEATFMPQHGGYALNNFTVQFDVFHNIVYENNSAFQGPFYQAADSQGNTIISMGIYQRQMHNNDVLQVGGLDFSNTTTGQSSHYYFPLSHAADWSTWRLTVTTALTEKGYVANVTVQIDGETATDFATGMPRPDGMGEIFVSDIINESVLNPVAYQNLLPLPQAGVLVPTYTPSPVSYGRVGIHYDLMSNTNVQPVSINGATPSYIDNFYYGYANTIPMSSAPTPTPAQPTPTATTQPTINTGPEPPQTEPFPTALSIAVIVFLVGTVGIGLLLYIKKRKRA